MASLMTNLRLKDNNIIMHACSQDSPELEYTEVLASTIMNIIRSIFMIVIFLRIHKNLPDDTTLALVGFLVWVTLWEFLDGSICQL